MFEYYFHWNNNDYSIIELQCDYEQSSFKSTVFVKARDRVRVAIYRGDLSSLETEDYNFYEILINCALQSCVAFANNQLYEEYNNCNKNLFVGEIEKYKEEKIINKIYLFYKDKEMIRMLLRHSLNPQFKKLVDEVRRMLDCTIREEIINPDEE